MEFLRPRSLLEDVAQGLERRRDARDAKLSLKLKIKAVRTLPPDIREGGLYEGFVQFSLQPTDNYKSFSMGRSVCDVSLLLVRHPDGSTDGFLSHFRPNLGYRRGQAELFDAIDLPVNPQDKTVAFLLSTIPQSDLQNDKGFEELRSALVRKNYGRDPYIEFVDIAEITNDRISEIVFTQQVVTDGYDQVVEVINPDGSQKFEFSYRKEKE